MRSLRSVRAILLGLGLGLVALGTAQRASADDEFDVHVEGHHVVVKTKGPWHINKEYPWRLMVGKTKVEGPTFNLSDVSAEVEAPQGTFKLRGGVCSGEQCVGLDRELTIK